MYCKSKKFIPACFIIFQIFIVGNVFSQRIIELPDITESLKQISKDAKDTILKYKDDPSVKIQKKVALAKRLDSIAMVCLEPSRVFKIFDRISPSLFKLKAPTANRLKASYLKSWLNYQIAALILGTAPEYEFNPGVDNSLENLLGLKSDSHAKDYEYNSDMSKIFEDLKSKTKNDPLKLLWSSPIDGQINFCPKHYEGGILAFNRIDQLKEYKGPGSFMMRWTDTKGLMLLSKTSFNSYNEMILFEIPKEQLVFGEIYKLDLVNIDINGDVKDLWKAKINGTKSIYNFPLKEFMISLCEISKPFSTIYFRMGNDDDIYYKFKKIEFANDNINGTLKIGPITEALDSLEIYGNQLIPPLITISCKRNYSSTYNLIFKPSVSNYLSVPIIVPASIDEYANLNSFELAGLINEEHVYIINENRNVIKESISQNGVSHFSNGYNFDFSVKENVKFNLIGKLAPKVTAKNFNAAKIVTENQKIEFSSDFQEQCKKRYNEVKEALKHRIQERALFFYNIEIRDCKRNGRIASKQLEDFIKNEMVNLPISVKSILNTDYIPEDIKPEENKYQVDFHRPFTKQRGFDSYSIRKTDKK